MKRIDIETPLKEIRKRFPDIEGFLRKIGHPSVAKAMASFANSEKMTFGNLARASGLTELEIGLLIEELNDKLPSLSSSAPAES